jgi:hypothetical protein
MKHRIKNEDEGVPFWVYAVLGSCAMGGIIFMVWLVWKLYSSVGAIL